MPLRDYYSFSALHKCLWRVRQAHFNFYGYKPYESELVIKRIHIKDYLKNEKRKLLCYNEVWIR